MLPSPCSQFQSPSPGGSTDSDDDQFPSYFDQVTEGCDVFRILLAGRAGSGKSTLVTEVFDFELDQENVQDFTVCPRLLCMQLTFEKDPAWQLWHGRDNVSQ